MKQIYTFVTENACGQETDKVEVKCTAEEISEELVKILQADWHGVIYSGDIIRILHE